MALVTPIGHAAAAQPAQTGFVFSPYKNVSRDIDKHTDVMRTSVTGPLVPLVGKRSLLATHEPKLRAITLAFANGSCGSEHWGDVPGQRFADANIRALDAAGVDYIVATGGEGQMFTCADPEGMVTFIKRYMSPHMLGIDFDIEDKQTRADIHALVSQVAYAQKLYPNLRFSFTIATWAASDGSYAGVNPLGAMVIREIKAARIRNYTIDLMVMDYGSTGANVCVVSAGRCDMGLSAIQAVRNLQHHYDIPASHIELTPMIGANDTPGEIFTIADVDTVASYVMRRGLAGVHFWSLDRDRPCGQTPGPSNCNAIRSGPALEYTDRFLSDFGKTKPSVASGRSTFSGP